MKMHLKVLTLLLMGLAPAAVFTHAQQAATEQSAQPRTQLEAMQHIEDLWSEALAKRDQYGLELLLSPQFVNISADGGVRSRNQEIAFVLNGFPDLISLEQKVATVRTLGDVAVVNGTYVLRRRASGHPVEEKGVFSHVYQRNRSNWQCINSQRTIVVEQNLDKSKIANNGKKSTAELPFHVPLLHKGADPASPQPGQSASDQLGPQ